MALHTKGNNGACVEMYHEFQCGVGMEGGVDIGYVIPNRALDILIQEDSPSAMLLTDAGNAYGSIMQVAAIEEVVKSRPGLVGFWAGCYGSPEAPWMIFDDGSRIEVASFF